MSSPAPKQMVFMGSDVITLPVLDYLWEERERVTLTGVYTQPDRARGRGKKIQPNAIKVWAQEKEIPVFQPEQLDEQAIQELSELNPDLILVMAYGHLLPKPVLELPKLGIYNIHTSLLPALRGASPIETAVASGYEESGVSLLRLVMKMDAGPVCDRETLSISDIETGGGFREKLAEASPRVLERNLSSMLDGSILSTEQNEEEVSYCRLLVKQDGQLDFSKSAEYLAHRINGLFPWPGCSAQLNGVMIKFGLAAYEEADPSIEPGVVVEGDTSCVRIGTGKGLLRILQLQRPGGKLLPAEAFLLGNPIAAGERFLSREMHSLVSSKPVSHKRVFQLYAKP